MKQQNNAPYYKIGSPVTKSIFSLCLFESNPDPWNWPINYPTQQTSAGAKSFRQPIFSFTEMIHRSTKFGHMM